MTNATSKRQQPNDEQRAGVAWWNRLSLHARRHWLEQASCSGRMWDVSAADAWAAFKDTMELRLLPVEADQTPLSRI
jgi:hypothetical protein